MGVHNRLGNVINGSPYILTAVSTDPEMKFLNDSKICSFVFVVLNSFDDVPSFFLTPSMRKPRVAVEEIVSRQTMYLKREIPPLMTFYNY